MELLHQLGSATVREIHEKTHAPPSTAAVRAIMKQLAAKGHVEVTKRGSAFLFYPTRTFQQASQGPMKRVVEGWFGDSFKTNFVSQFSPARITISDNEMTEVQRFIKRSHVNPRSAREHDVSELWLAA